MKSLSNNHEAFNEEVLSSELPVLVDFYADWCGPCAVQTPILESFESEFKDKVRIVKIDVDQHSELSRSYGIRSIPTLMLFDQGERIATHVGLGDRKEISALLSSVA